VDFCGFWLVSVNSLKSGGDDDAAEFGGHVGGGRLGLGGVPGGGQAAGLGVGGVVAGGSSACATRAPPDKWVIGIYRASTGQYSENELPGSFGSITGTPEQGVDETLILYAGPATAS
jgi:hypothetical protein